MKGIMLFTTQLGVGGAEKVLSLLSLKLPHNYEKTLVIFDGRKIDYSHDGEMIDLKIYPGNSLLSKINMFVRGVRQLKKIKKEKGIQSTISFLGMPNIINIFSRHNDKVIVSVRNFHLKKNENIAGIIAKILLKTFYNKADVIVAVSELIKHDLITNFHIDKRKLKVIYNPYDIGLIRKLADEEIDCLFEPIFENLTLINVGRLERQKGQKYLIMILSKLKKRIPNVKLIILGNGSCENELKEQVKRLQLENSVFFLGFQKNPYKFIRKSNLFVFTSLFEGFPNSLVEAMACGTPVISSDCKSGPREILAPGTNILEQTKIVERAKYGVLMPVINVDNDKILDLWVEEILSLIKNKEIVDMYSKIAMERVQDFAVERIVFDWIELID